MRLAYSEKDVREGFESVKREGLNSFEMIGYLLKSLLRIPDI